MHARRLLTLVAVLSLGGRDALAQDRLFFDGSEVGAFGRFAERIGPSHGLEGPLIAGGRLLVRAADVVDLRTGATRALPAGAAVAALDPARPRLLLALPGSAAAGTLDVARFDVVTGELTPLASSVCPSELIGPAPARLGYAYSAETVFLARCAAPAAVQDFVAIDLQAASPAVRVLAIPATQRGALTASPDGRRLYFSEGPELFFGPGTTTAYDTATGARIGVVGAGGEVVWDEALERLLIQSRHGLETVMISLFGRDLQFLGAAPLFSRICMARLQVSPHTGRIYVTTNGASNTTAQPARLFAFAGDPPGLAATALLPQPSTPSCAGAVLRTAPGAPRDVSAGVSGRTVTLHWTNVGGAAGFVVDVGLSSGRTDVSIAVGAASKAAFAGVPPGTYYVRVRGGNEFGGGRPSSEVRVVVP